MKEYAGRWPYLSLTGGRFYTLLVAGIGAVFAIYVVLSRVTRATYAHDVEKGIVYFTYLVWTWLLVLFVATVVAAAVIQKGMTSITWFRRNRLFHAVAVWLLFPGWAYAWGVTLVGAALATYAAKAIEDSQEDLPPDFWQVFLHERIIHVMNVLTLLLLLIPLTPAVRYALWQEWQNLRRTSKVWQGFMVFCYIAWFQLLPMVYFIAYDVEKVYAVKTGIEPRAWRGLVMYLAIMAIGVLVTLPLFFFYTRSPATDDPAVIYMKQTEISDDAWHNQRAQELKQSLSFLHELATQDGDMEEAVVAARAPAWGGADAYSLFGHAKRG